MHPATGITLKEAQEMYRKYMEAERLILSHQRYRIEDRELERASLKDITEGKKEWERICIDLSAGNSRRTVSIIPSNL